jgi:ribosomal protein S18 acetylase RimI-like enzyme
MSGGGDGNQLQRVSADQIASERQSPLIRPIRPEEHETVARLTVSTYAEVLGPSLTEDYRVELADVARRASEAEVLVAVEPDGVVGSVTYVSALGPYAEFGGADEAGIRMLVVAPAAQRRGAGAALVQACVDRARAGGKTRVVLHTTPSMLVAQRLYERLGFQRAPERDWSPEDEHIELLGFVLEL